MSTIGDYLDKVKDFETLTQKEQVKLVSYFYVTVQNKELFSSSEIIKCFESEGLKLPANMPHNLNILSDDRPPILVRRKKLYSFERSAKKKLDDLYNTKYKSKEGLESKEEKIKKLNNLIGVITASPDEFNSIKTLLTNVEQCPSEDNDSVIYYKGFIESENKKIELILPYPLDMGIPAAVISTTKVILKFKPKYLFMVGITAGNKKVNNIGDIIIAEKSLNYNEVVEIEKKGNESVKKSMQAPDCINKNLKSLLSQFSDSSHIKIIQSGYSAADKIDTVLKCSKGLLVTGSSLIRSQSKVEEINETYHNVVGLDMETNGFYYASAHSLKETSHYFASIKSVSDFGDNTSHKLSPEERKKYALYTSSNALKYFILKYIDLI